MPTTIKKAKTAKVTSSGELDIHPPLETLGEKNTKNKRNPKYFFTPPALTTKQENILHHCITIYGNRWEAFTQGAQLLESFIVGVMPNGEERDVKAYIRLNGDCVDKFCIILIDCQTRVYTVNGINQLAAMVDLIRKEHNRWLYEKFPDSWAKQLKEREGEANIYFDDRKDIFGYNENAR